MKKAEPIETTLPPDWLERPAKHLLRCPICGELYDPEKDPYHLEACREAMKP